MEIQQPPINSPKKKFNNAWIYIPIVLLLIGSNIFLYYQKNNQETDHQDQIVTKDSTIVTLKSEYDASLVRLDDLMGKNAALDSMLVDKNSELSKIKARINELTNKSKMSAEELQEAKVLIASLRKKIDGYEQEIGVLKAKNASLTGQVETLTSDNQTLTEQIDLGKILAASNIQMTPIDLRRNGNKEVETTKAKRVDVLRVKFDIVKNLLDEGGNKEFFIVMRNPDGELLSNPSLGSGSFVNANGSNVNYSVSKTVNLEKGQELKDIVVDWNQATSYEKGNYQVEIYHKGYQIGNGTIALR